MNYLWIVCPECGNLMDIDNHVDIDYKNKNDALISNKNIKFSCDASEELNGYSCFNEFLLTDEYVIEDETMDEDYEKLKNNFNPKYKVMYDEFYEKITCDESILYAIDDEMVTIIYEQFSDGKTPKQEYPISEIKREIAKHLNNGIDPHSIMFGLFFKRPEVFGEDDNHTKDKRKEYVYILHSDFGFKIGRSHEPQIRSRTIGTKTPFVIKKTEIFEVESMSKAENGLHRHFKDFRLNGEWFNLTDLQIVEAREIITKRYKRQ